MTKTFSVKEAFSFGWNTFKKNKLFWIVCFFLVSSLSSGGGGNYSLPSNDNDVSNKNDNSYNKYQMIPENLEKNEYFNDSYEDNLEESLPSKVMGAMTEAEDISSFLPFFLMIPFVLIAIPLAIVIIGFFVLLSNCVSMGYIKQVLNAVRNKELKYETLLSEVFFGKAFRYLLASLLYAIIVVLGFLLFIIPGIYFSLKYQFFAYFIVDKNAKVMDSFKMSAKLTDGVKGKLMGLGFASIGVMILGILALLVGIIPASIVISLATAYVYETLRKQTFETNVIEGSQSTVPAPEAPAPLPVPEFKATAQAS